MILYNSLIHNDIKLIISKFSIIKLLEEIVELFSD